MAELNKRELVKECIEKGNMTKAEIAEHLEMSAGSVSTQMTYLRWMDHYIMTDPDTKILSFTDKETYEAFEAEKKANRKTKTTAARTPEERAVAIAKTIKTQEGQLAKWKEKESAAAEMLKELPEDENAILNHKEAVAQVALLEVKLVRNKALAAELPTPVVAEAEEAEEADDEDSDVEESEDEETELL